MQASALKIVCLCFGLITLLFILPYIITGWAFINNKYISPVMLKADILLSYDRCEAQFNCEECKYYLPNNITMTKSNCLQEFLKKIPQSQDEYYFVLGSFYYPKILIILRSISDIIIMYLRPFMILVNVVGANADHITNNIKNNESITISIISIGVFGICCLCILCCVPCYIISNKTNKRISEEQTDEKKDEVICQNAKYININEQQDLQFDSV